jgi:two-component sensor histidine kinase
LHHRTKNLFAVVQAVVSRSFAGKQTVEEAEAAVLDRLHSLAQTHMLLLEKEWQGTDLMELVRHEMRPFTSRVVMSGPAIILSPQAAQNFALALHELATNAAKHGALSTSRGRVGVTWSIAAAAGGSQALKLEWREQGDKPVSPPTRESYGLSTIRNLLRFEHGATVDVLFTPSGLNCVIVLPLRQAAPAPQEASATIATPDQPGPQSAPRFAPVS